MKQLLMDKLFFLDGWTRPEVGPSDTPRPTYQESDFKIVCPVASGHLPIRKEWIDMMQNKYENQSIKDELQEVIVKHNELHNPSGRPHDPVSGVNKRAASEAGLLAGPEIQGMELPREEGAPKNEAELAQSDGPLSKLQCMGQTLYFTHSGHMWLWGEKDDVLPAGFCLVLIYGTFHLQQDVEKRKKEAAKKNGKIWDWNVTSEDYSGVYISDKAVNGQLFPKDTARTFKEFLSHLASAGIIDPHMECHELQRSLERQPPSRASRLAASESANAL
jgi:hypothetical protein